MDKQIQSSLVSGGLGALGSLANGVLGFFGAKEQRKWEAKQAQIQRDWNEQMMDKQNAFTVDMWNKTNEYNDPSNQLERMKAAGLNPLYYGLDGSSANGIESAQALGYERPSGGQSPAGAGLEAALQTASLAADVSLKKAQARKLEKDAEGQEIDNANKPKYWQAQLALMGANRDEALANIAKLEQDVKTGAAEEALKKANKNLADAQITAQGLNNGILAYKLGMAAVDAKYYEAMKHLDLMIKQATELKTEEEVKNLRKTRALIAAQIVSEGSKSKMFEKNADMNDASARNIRKKTAWIDAEEIEKITNLSSNSGMLQSLAAKYDAQSANEEDKYVFALIDALDDMATSSF